MSFDPHAAQQAPQVPQAQPVQHVPQAPQVHFPASAAQHPAPPAPEPLASVPWGSVGLFVVLALGLAWIVALPIWLADLSNPAGMSLGTQLLIQFTPVAMMFTPAIAMLVVVFLAKTPRTGRARFLGLWPLRPAKRVVWFIVLGALAPAIVVALALLVATLFGWFTPDFENLSGFTAALGPAATSPEAVRTILYVQLAMFPIAGLLNLLPAFGEEIGWRGWLLPALRPLGTWRALVLSGVIWGVWHAPLTLMGHNFQLFDWRGVVLMTVGSVVWGVLFGWLRLRSGSVWPAVLAHGALNGAGALFALFAMAGVEQPLWLVNPLGVSGWIAAAIIILVLIVTKQFGKEPALAPPRR